MVLSIAPCGAEQFVKLNLFMSLIISALLFECRIEVLAFLLNPVIVQMSGKRKAALPCKRKAAVRYCCQCLLARKALIA